VVVGAKVLAGQAALVPVQLSAVSQAPVEARHWVEALENVSVGHTPLVPLQVST